MLVPQCKQSPNNAGLFFSPCLHGAAQQSEWGLRHRRGPGGAKVLGLGPLGNESSAMAVRRRKQMWTGEHRSGSDGEQTKHHLFRRSSLSPPRDPLELGEGTKGKRGANVGTHTISWRPTLHLTSFQQSLQRSRIRASIVCWGASSVESFNDPRRSPPCKVMDLGSNSGLFTTKASVHVADLTCGVAAFAKKADTAGLVLQPSRSALSQQCLPRCGEASFPLTYFIQSDRIYHFSVPASLTLPWKQFSGIHQVLPGLFSSSAPPPISLSAKLPIKNDSIYRYFFIPIRKRKTESSVKVYLVFPSFNQMLYFHLLCLLDMLCYMFQFALWFSH